jgi:hypothetical protein
MSENRYSLGRCYACGKFVYRSRKDARAAAKNIHGSGNGLNAYECHLALEDGITGLWHFGHLLPQIVKGESSRAIYGGVS